ncbi:MAG: FAD-binding oxidoreductase [Acidiferrobacterales bacterium]
MGGIKVQNWKRAITYYAKVVEVVHSVDDIVRIVKDKQRYPSPVRVKGSHHSTTRCIVAEDGTVIDITKMNQILDIDEKAKTITMQAGVFHIDAARELEKHNLQFYVNVEIGNLTVGSGACGATKDASYFSEELGKYEFGQVASYVVGLKAVLPSGEILEVTEDQGELLEVMRSSYGMLGIIFEVTYKVKEIKPMAVEHVSYHVDEFADRLDELIGGNRSMMLYLFPFLDRVVVEYRYDGSGPITSNSWQWRLRNWVWKTAGPAFGKTVTTFIPFKGIRYWLIDRFNQLTQALMPWVLRGCHTSPVDQIIRYPETAGYASYTFSIWAFPREEYPQTIRAYYRFCKDYYKENGYRCDLLNVGYNIAKDTSSLFSYTSKGPALTLDPVSTASKGWFAFLTAYNEFCIQHNGTPLFNQTPRITPLQAKAAFGPEIEKFQEYRRKYDPEDRFYIEYFRKRFE